jgi:hypothetical protein
VGDRDAAVSRQLLEDGVEAIRLVHPAERYQSSQRFDRM